MSRFTGSIFKKSRQLGISILENNREFDKWKGRVTPPGQHGASKRGKISIYGEQLKEKKKVGYVYGLTDTQLRRFFKVAKKQGGSLSDNLMLLLERRLDNMVFRMNFAPTRRAARQLVSHGHIRVNGRRLDIPSALVNVNDVIEVAEKKRHIALVNMMNEYDVPDYLDVDVEGKKGVVLRFPKRQEMNPNINEVYVVEWYKRLV